MTTFKVDKVKKAKAALPTADVKTAITAKIGVEPESCFKFPESLHPTHSHHCIKNSFVGAVHTAFDGHYPLVLSPDMIWQCVAQGFAIHVNKNAEKLRHLFVAHEGKKVIEVRVDHFQKGSPTNDWEGTLGLFSEEIRKNIGDDIHGLLTPEFSTTGPVEKAAAQVVMMGAFKEYFRYCSMTMCGIPEITLEGSVKDWKKLYDKTLNLAKFDLQWWIDAIEPVLKEFVKAASGKINKDFWRSIYKFTDASGGSYINGWIIILFPYLGHTLEKMSPNTYLEKWNPSNSSDFFFGVDTTSFPQGSVSAPFKWLYLDEEYDMYFYAGFMGVGQDQKSLAIRPVIGWAVVDKEEEEKTKMLSGGADDGQDILARLEELITDMKSSTGIDS